MERVPFIVKPGRNSIVASAFAGLEADRKKEAKLTTPSPAVLKENVIVSKAYEAVVRKLACRRCGYKPPAPKGNEFCHGDMNKGKAIKTDVREGWAGCGDRRGVVGCHFIIGTSGQYTKEERRAFELEYAKSTREEVNALGLWPKSLPQYEADLATRKVSNARHKAKRK